MRRFGGLIGVILLISVAIAAESTILSMGRGTPDLVLAVVLGFALTRGSLTGAIIGFTGGIMQDLYVDGVIGLAAILKTIAGFSVGLIGDHVRAEKWQLAFISSFGVAISYQLVYGASLFIFGLSVSSELFFSGMVWQPALLTALFAMPVFLLLRRRSGAQMNSVMR